MIPGLEGLADEQIVDRVLRGETSLFELIVRRFNQRLYRTTRAILRNDALAEEALEDAYVRAYRHLSEFAGHVHAYASTTDRECQQQPQNGH